MEDLTSAFRKYDLEDIKTEYISSLSGSNLREPLPEYVGGCKVQLLIGIKNSHLVPVLIKTLDSGVGVYRSPFKDIFGSRIIFAGPHASFTRGNRGIREEVSLAVFHIYQRREQIRTGTQIPHLIVGDKETGAGVHPTPLSRTDFIQLGADPGPDLTAHNSQAQYTGLEAHVCRIKGDQIPIARMRELINQDDPEGLISVRCSSCAVCITCRKSPRTNAIFLQESREQEVIEKSVSINLEKATVQVKLPFMMDPVPFLRKKHGADNNFKQASSVLRSQCKKPEEDRVPLYHVDGTRNLTDLLTKDHDIKVEQMSIGSPWQDGEPCMKLDFKDMPLSIYEMLSLDKKSQEEVQNECFSELFLPESQKISINFVPDPGPSGPKEARVWSEFIINPIRLGWMKTIRILNIVLKFKDVVKHKTFHGYSVVECRRCLDVERNDPRDNHQKSKDILFKYESRVVLKTLSNKQLSNFTENEGTLYFHSRISNENPFKFKDLDRIPFFDAQIIRNPLPVVMKDSPLLYSLVISIHCRSTPHPGIEKTVREVFKEMFVIGGLRELLRNRSLEGAGIEIERTPHLERMLEKSTEIYTVWCSIFMDNIHELMVKPDKWDITGIQPKLEDIVMVIFNDSGYSKEQRVWILGRVTQVQPRKITIEYVSKVSIQGILTLDSVSGNPRDISILFSTEELFINTPEHFKNLFNQD